MSSTNVLAKSESSELDLVKTQEPAAASAGMESVFGRDHLRTLKLLQHQMLLEGKQVFDLSMVNPDLSPPRAVLDRLLESVTKPQNHRYAVSRGIRRLREAFASKYASRFGLSLNPDTEVCVCLGSKDATYHALKSLITQGDAVVVSSPSYPAHVSSITLAGGVVTPWEYSTDPSEAAASLDRLLASCRARVVLLNFPSNPAGVVVSEEWWSAIADVCWRHSAAIINDFVYGEMCFLGDSAVSALRARERGVRCVEVYSLSKAYNVPGWRVGALVGDSQIVQAVARWKSHSDYGLFLPLQYAASVALTSSTDLVRPTVMSYERRLKVLSSGLRKLGWEVQEPEAGACLWARYPATIVPEGDSAKSLSVRVASEVLRTTGVLVTPGIVFGDPWDGYVRFSAVVTEERMREVVAALARMRCV
jgi:alanine-synthesizing transaminase